MPSTSVSVPPTPAYIFRLHDHPIHALHFFASNTLLASGDSSGLLIIWRLTTRRPAIVFQAHDGGIMGIKDWMGDRLITHGRDHRLRVWDIKLGMSRDSEQPVGRPTISNGRAEQRVDNASSKTKEQKPWLLHALPMNALNFCAFATCYAPEVDQMTANQTVASSTNTKTSDTESEPGPAHIDQRSCVNVQSAPHPPLLIASPNGLDSGGIDIFELPSEKRISQIRSKKDAKEGMVMALSIRFREDTGRFIVVAGFEDGSVGVYVQGDSSPASASAGEATTSMSWLWERVMAQRVHSQPVLSLDVTPDCKAFITSSADALLTKFDMPGGAGEDIEVIGKHEPDRSTNTKHAGQQDLKVRSDGKIVATAGWDGNVRVYSTKTLKELAVLQWHKEGCYAVAFAEVLSETGNDIRVADENNEAQALVSLNGMEKMKLQRDRKVQMTHWIVAGSKDGKISLWDIY